METAAQSKPASALPLELARATLIELGAASSALSAALEAGAEVATLTNDADLAVATALHCLLQEGLDVDEVALEARLGPGVMRLVRALKQLAMPRLPDNWSGSTTLPTAQAEALRKMLLAVAGDPRLLIGRLS